MALTHNAAPGEGHLNVSVRPSHRRQGHGTAILAAALPIAHGYGVDPIRLTADSTDTAACKMIENTGGRLLREERGRREYQASASNAPTTAPQGDVSA